MDDHLAKPLTKGELESTLAKWLRLDDPTPDASVPRAARGVALDTALIERLESELGDGGKELLAGLIEVFLVDFQQTLGHLTEHLQGGRLEKVAFEAHRSRSSTSNLGAVELSQLCERLEQCAQRGDASLAAQLVLALREAFPLARDALLEFARRPASPSLAAFR
jgi:HPt (histidine-containing phosphotransfer) domain-containing protein